MFKTQVRYLVCCNFNAIVSLVYWAYDLSIRSSHITEYSVCLRILVYSLVLSDSVDHLHVKVVLLICKSCLIVRLVLLFKILPILYVPFLVFRVESLWVQVNSSNQFDVLVIVMIISRIHPPDLIKRHTLFLTVYIIIDSEMIQKHCPFQLFLYYILNILFIFKVIKVIFLHYQ